MTGTRRRAQRITLPAGTDLPDDACSRCGAAIFYVYTPRRTFRPFNVVLLADMLDGAAHEAHSCPKDERGRP